MTKHRKKDHSNSDHTGYKQTLHQLQIELVKLQNQIIKSNAKILVLLEGRDTAGKDGVIKRITQHLSPRETRVVAPASRLTTIVPLGIFSDTRRTCPPLRKWSCSIAVGTTVPASSG